MIDENVTRTWTVSCSCCGLQAPMRDDPLPPAQWLIVGNAQSFTTHDVTDETDQTARYLMIHPNKIRSVFCDQCAASGCGS